jgi:hypothetical protein
MSDDGVAAMRESDGTSLSSANVKPEQKTSSDGRGLLQVHYLPCSIKYDGPTDVGSFFRVAKDPNTGTLTSHMRGRELKGSVVDLPSKVSGLCVTPGVDDPRRWEVTGQFDSMTVWQHDVTPDVAQMQEYLHYFELSKAVHE